MVVYKEILDVLYENKHKTQRDLDLMIERRSKPFDAKGCEHEYITKLINSLSESRDRWDRAIEDVVKIITIHIQ